MIDIMVKVEYVASSLAAGTPYEDLDIVADSGNQRIRIPDIPMTKAEIQSYFNNIPNGTSYYNSDSSFSDTALDILQKIGAYGSIMYYNEYDYIDDQIHGFSNRFLNLLTNWYGVDNYQYAQYMPTNYRYTGILTYPGCTEYLTLRYSNSYGSLLKMDTGTIVNSTMQNQNVLFAGAFQNTSVSGQNQRDYIKIWFMTADGFLGRFNFNGPTKASNQLTIATAQQQVYIDAWFSQAPAPTFDRTDVFIAPDDAGAYTISTEDSTDTINIIVDSGYEFATAELYSPQGVQIETYRELPIIVERTESGTYSLNVNLKYNGSPYEPATPIEDLPSDTIIPTYPANYIGKYIGAGFYKLFIPTIEQLNAFVNYLYNQTFIDAVVNLWNRMLNIEDLIVGVMIIPGAPSIAGTAVPRVGWVQMTASQAMNFTNQQYIEIDLGELTVSRAWNNYLDYAPYTKISVYLPFIGERTLDTNDVMNKTLKIIYHIDLMSGNCVAYVHVNGSVHYQFSGNCAYSIPISSADTANLFLQPLKAIAGLALAGAGVATGNPMMVAAGSSLGATIGSSEEGATVSAPSAEISAPNIRKVDGLNSNTGYMGTVRPYLSIERVRPDINSGFGKAIGYQANKYRTLSQLSGYTKVAEVHLEGINATTAELTQIEAMLKGGIII